MTASSAAASASLAGGAAVVAAVAAVAGTASGRTVSSFLLCLTNTTSIDITETLTV